MSKFDQCPTSYHTIVVGMGAAGAVAAAKLAKAGKAVLGLEATAHCGGRVRSVRVPEGVVEPGAEWIYGDTNNPVFEAAQSHGLTLESQEMDFEVFRAHGDRSDHVAVNELAGYCIDMQFLDTPRVHKSYPEFITRQIKHYVKSYRKSSAELLNNKDFYDDLLKFANASVCVHKGTNDWNELSAFTDYEDLDGSKHLSWHKLGFSTYLDIVLNTFNDGPGYPKLAILFKKQVVSVKWPKLNPKAVATVKCKDGSVYYASHVIVAVPLGVLKEKHTTLFDPKLPAQKINAINTMGLGVIDKITLIFPNQWWEGDKDDQLAFFWDAKSRSKVAPEDQWMLNIVKATIPLGVSNAITMWISGEAAIAMERLDDELVSKKCMDILRWFLGTDRTVPQPIRVVRSAWYANKFTRGSDSFEHINELPHARQILSEPLLDVTGSPRVLFAGEATHPKHYSTVHGAASSGLREANRLLPQRGSLRKCCHIV